MQFHSHRYVAVPSLWINTDETGFDWLDQPINDYTIPISVSLIYLKISKKRRHMFESTNNQEVRSESHMRSVSQAGLRHTISYVLPLILTEVRRQD